MDFVTLSIIFFSIAIAIDILYSKKDRIITFKKAFVWSFIWIFVSIIFIIVAHELKVNDFFTLMAIYLTEKILSINNLSIFLLIFSLTKINIREKLKVLTFGIYISIILRIMLIFIGTLLVNTFLNISYLLISILLLFFGYSMIKEKNEFLNRFLYLIEIFGKNISKEVTQKFPMFHLSFSKLITLIFLIGIVNFIFSLDNAFSVLVISSDFISLLVTTLLAVIGLKPLYFLLENVAKKVEKLKLFLGIYMFYLAFESFLKVFGIEIPNSITICVLLTLISIPIILHFSKDFTPSHKRKEKIEEKSSYKNYKNY